MKKTRIILLGSLLLILVIRLLLIFKIYKSSNNNTVALSFPSYTLTSAFPVMVDDVPVKTSIIDEGKARPRTLRLIKYVVIHETDNYESGAGAKNHAVYLKENNSTSTSWHYTVDDKEIYHHIPDNEVAHHAGDKDGNMYGIGIELCVNKGGNFNKTFDNAAKLVAYLLKSYDLDINAIKTHHDFTGKDCPNKILKMDRLDEFKNKVQGYLE